MDIFWLELALQVSKKAVYFDHGFDNPETSWTYFYSVNTSAANLSSFLRVQGAAVRWSSSAAEASV